MENAEKIFTRCEQEGFSYIQQIISKQQVENIFLTFRRKTDYTNSILSKDDKKIFKENVSFFSRISGGVIIWGIASSKNKDGVNIAKKMQPISNGKTFLNNLNCLLLKDFITINSDIKNIYIPFPKEEKNGFVITYIPRNDYLLSLNNYYTKNRDYNVMMMGQALLHEVLKNRRL
ncbi:hypothetical protein ACT7C7_29750 [Bacillus cereus]